MISNNSGAARQSNSAFKPDSRLLRTAADLVIDDRLYWFSTGAHTTSHSAVEFNGFPPLKQYLIG